MLKIEKSIPLPKPTHAAWTEAFRQMKPGDSVFVEAKTEAAIKTKRSNAFTAAKACGVNLITRRVDGGLRLWVKGK